MKSDKKLIYMSNAPHIGTRDSVNLIMWTVSAALLPAGIFSVYTFGTKAFIMIAVCTLSAILTELFTRLLLKRKITIHNGSAFLTGLLLAYNMPPDAPVWMGAAGSIFAIIIVKELFGGLGGNIFNPALAARAFLVASWPTAMTTSWHKFSTGNIFGSILEIQNSAAADIITQATPLSVIKYAPQKAAEAGIETSVIYEFIFSMPVLKSLASGNIGGCIGETSAILLLIGAAVLLIRRIITWHTPVAYLLSFSAVIFIYYTVTGGQYAGQALMFHLLSGGLILGVFFMATDMVTSPSTPLGMIIFGAGGGILASLIRLYGGYPEGVSYSILLMNCATPLIDRFIKPRVYGTGGSK